MKNLFILTTFILIFSLNTNAQQEKLEVGGAIQIGDSEDPTPDPGTIRWTGTDFEGWNGTVWLSLTYSGTCSDGVQNQDETDIDCGGSVCIACPTCSDGIQNQDETDIDCGGSVCIACPTCFDGVQNQDETDIDCGGTICDPCTPDLNIGDAYEGGIIFYLDGSGDHGLVCAPFDQSTGTVWGCSGTLIYGADSTEVGYGAQNTMDIVDGCPTLGIAAEICASLSLNGYDDWYLPSKEELHLMWLNLGQGNALGLGNVGNFLSFRYFSSTEIDAQEAWKEGFTNGNQNNASKTQLCAVRAVRSF